MTNAVIGALRINFSADTAEFRRNMTEAERIAERFGRSIGSSVRRNVLAFGAAVAAAAGPAALGLLIKSSIETVSAQVDLAKRVGASVGAIQTLQETAKLAGASQEALAATLGKLNQRLGEAARTGAGPAHQALKQLGLSAKELSEMDADERIKTLSDRMAELGMTTQQQADILKSLGVRQLEIINLFQEGSEAIERTRNELKGFGVLLSDVDAGKVEEAGDAIDKLFLIAKGLGNQLAVELSPIIIRVVENISKMARSGELARSVINTFQTAWKRLNDEWIRGNAIIEVTMRRWQLAQEVIASFRFGQKGGVDWEAFRAAHAKAADDISKIWIDRDQQLANLHGPGILLSGLEAHLNSIHPLVQSVDKHLASIQNKIAPDGEQTDADRKAQETRQRNLAQFQEDLATRFLSLQESLMTEREAEMASYDQRLLDLETFHQNGILSEQEYRDALVRSSEDHASKLKAIDDDIARNNERNAKKQMDTYFDIADNIQSALGSLFGDSKAWAIAEAIINTATAITKALAVYGPTPQGFAAAAAAAAAGAAQLAAIRKQSASGGGGGNPQVSRSSSSRGDDERSSAQQTAQAGLNQTLFIKGLNPNELYSGEAVRKLAASLIEFQRDGGKIVLAKS